MFTTPKKTARLTLCLQPPVKNASDFSFLWKLMLCWVFGNIWQGRKKSRTSEDNLIECVVTDLGAILALSDITKGLISTFLFKHTALETWSEQTVKTRTG